MVGALPRLALVAGITLWLAPSLPAGEVAPYRVGDTVAEDIVTPFPLTVIDPDATAALKLKAAQGVPVILRYDPTLLEKVENELRDAFASNRSNFLNAVEASFGRRKLNEAAIALPKFQRVIASFKRQKTAFPLSTNLAELWARGDPGRTVQAEVLARVREVMEHPVRLGAWPENLNLGHLVCLVAVSNSDDTITLDTADQRGVNLPRTNLLILGRARTNLQSRFPPEEQALAKFAAIWLRPNCFVDLDLTRQARARHTDPLSVADHYEAGQVIARAGQVVDRKTLAALKQLGERTTAGRLPQPVARDEAGAALVRRRGPWLVAGLALLTLVSTAAIWRRARRRRNTSLLPATVAGDVAGAVISCPSCEQTILVGADVESWQQRAWAAEQKAEQARRAIRTGVLTHLTQLLREKFVRALISQRGQLLDAQRSATAEMAELERRLNELRLPLQERLRAYEKRISDLEKALAVKGEENRELIKAKIQLTRRQLEAERARNRVVLN
jgi:hypothetical protein